MLQKGAFWLWIVVQKNSVAAEVNKRATEAGIAAPSRSS